MKVFLCQLDSFRKISKNKQPQFHIILISLMCVNFLIIHLHKMYKPQMNENIKTKLEESILRNMGLTETTNQDNNVPLKNIALVQESKNE